MSSNKKSSDQAPSTTSLLVGTFADITWRMFAPVLVFTLAGWMIDKTANTKPIFILIGLAIGVASSVFLTVKLYKKVAKMHKGA